MLNKVKLGPKLIGGFVIVAVIAAVIGIVGIFNLNTVEYHMHDISKVMLPSVQSLLVISEAQTAVDAGENALLSKDIDDAGREAAFKRFTDAKKRSDDAWKIYEPLHQTKEEAETWKEFVPAWEAWRKDHEAFVAFAKQYEAGLDAGKAKDSAEMEKMYHTMSNQALNVNGISFEKAESLLNKIIEIVDDAAVEDDLAGTEAAESAKFILITVMIIGIIVSVVLGFMLTRSITNPLNQVVSMANKIAEGDLNQQKLVLKTKDEIGTLAESFNKMIDSIKEKAGLLEKIADNDLTIDVKLASDRDNLGISLTKMVTSLNEVLGMVNGSVEQVSAGAGQVSAASQQLSQGASEQASTLEEITSSITEINSQAKQNADNAAQANAIAKQSMDNADKGNKQMAELVTAMAGINQSAEDIKKIVKAIDDIAFQINLLALNANVEAARAGKYGKGFAVVAEEVRNLAGRSGKSVQETNMMVEAAIKNISMGSALVEATSKQLAEIVTGASKVADLVEEITVASKEQAQGLDQINVGLGQIDQVTQANTSSAEESASASEELASQGQQLKAMVARFKLATGNGKAKAIDMSSDLIQRLVHEELAKQEKHAHMERLHTINEQKKVTPVAQKPEGRGGKHLTKPEDVIKLDDSDFGKF